MMLFLRAMGCGMLMLSLLFSNTGKAQIKEKLGVPQIRMPGVNYRGKFKPLNEQEAELAKQLKYDVNILAGEIGERHLESPKLVQAALYLENSLKQMGYSIERQEYQVRGRTTWNIIAEKKGTEHPDEIIVIGAHYDSIPDSPGANDNASGTAAVLAIARAFTKLSSKKTLRFVFFTNEEPPYFQTETMGSLVYAKACKEKNENILGMLSLETLGYYSNEPKSQRYPPPFAKSYPSTGDFVAFVGNGRSASLVKQMIGSFRQSTKFPSEGAALSAQIPGVGWSDQWSFWQVGYPALMITDTAPFRYPHYHKLEDTPDKLNYDHMARVVLGVQKAIVEWTEQPAEPQKKTPKIALPKLLQKVK